MRWIAIAAYAVSSYANSSKASMNTLSYLIDSHWGYCALLVLVAIWSLGLGLALGGLWILLL